MSYKKYKWEAVAGDYNSPFFRNHLWTKSFFKYPELLGVPRGIFGVLSKENQILYLADPKGWLKAHEGLKAKAIKDHRFIDKLIDHTNRWGEDFNRWTEKNIFKKDLSQLDNGKLIKLVSEFIDRQGSGYAYGTSAAIMDFQGFAFVENSIKKFLDSKAPKKDFDKYYRIFTEPSNLSYAQAQEEDLLRLISEYYRNNKWRKDILEKTPDEVERLHPLFFRKLREHSQKYAWVYYVYQGPAYTEHEFLDFIKDYLNKKTNPVKKLQELRRHRERIKKLKASYLKKLKPDKFNSAIIKLAGKLVWGKPRRKDYQSRSYYHAEKLLQEIAKRLYISLQQARSMPLEMLKDAMAGKSIDAHVPNEIFKLHICLPNDDGTVATLYGSKAKLFAKKIRIEKPSRQSGKIREISGNCAFAGKAKGTVAIINLPGDMKKMSYGNILVSTATSPSIVPAIKKAAAIITDEGGLTCHAAIVSREMKIPCVVGTKIATKVLKDGDMVEVDADKGIVKKL